MQSIQAGLNRADIDTTEIETLISESGDEKHQLMIFAITYSARRSLPYGRWTTHEGHEILFNREYQPIAWRLADGTLAHAVRDEIIEDIVKEEFFYNDSNSPIDYLTRKVSSRVLTEEEKKACQRSLLICLTLLREFSPPRTRSESPAWSLYE
jgi:hypothetical protein